MKIILTKQKIDTFVIAVLFFSAAALWTMSTAKIYIMITGLCIVYAGYRMAQRQNSNMIFQSPFFQWITVVLSFISIDAFFRTKASIFNYDFQFFTWVTVIVVLAVLFDCNDEMQIISIICDACTVVGIAIIIYMALTGSFKISAATLRLDTHLSGNVITVAMNLGYCSIGILYNFLKKRRMIYLLIFAGVALVMLLTGSKLIFFTFFCEMLMYIRTGSGAKKTSRLLVISIAAILCIIIILTNDKLYTAIGSRTIDFLYELGLLKKVNAQRSNSTITRLALIKTAFICFKQHPIIGNGFGIVASMPPYYAYAHNNYMELLACYGMIGFILFYGFHLSIICKLRNIIRINRLEIIFLITLVLNQLCNDLTQVTYSVGWLNYIGLLIASAYFSVKVRRKEENNHVIEIESKYGYRFD